MKHKFDFKKSGKFVLVLNLFLCVSLSACAAQKPQTAGPRQLPPVNVKPVKAVMSPIVLTVEYPAILQASQEVNVSPEAAGKVASIDVNLGTQVEKGQPLFYLDTTDLQTQLKQQQANREYYRASLERTRESSSQQVLTAEQALNKAQIAYEDAKAAYEKNQMLYKTGGLSQQALSDSETKLKNTLNDLNSAQENLNMLKEKIVPQTVVTAEAQLRQAESSIESASTKLDNAAVRAPISGIISARNISAGEMVTSSTRAVTIIDTSTLIANVGVPYKMAEKTQKGQAVQIKLGTEDARVLEGIVDAVSPSADSTSLTYTVKIRIDNKNNAMKPGAFVKVYLPTEKKENVITVPNQAIVIENGVRYIYAVEEGKVKKKSVTVGLANDKITEVTGNLKEGDLVITEGQIFINDGQRVTTGGDGTGGSGQGSNPSGNRPQGTGQQGQGNRSQGTGNQAK